MRDLLLAAADVVVVLDSQAIVLDMHARMDQQEFLLPPKEQIGRNIREGLTPQQLPDLESFFQRARSGERVGFTVVLSGARNGAFLRGRMAPWAVDGQSGVLDGRPGSRRRGHRRTA